MTNALRWRRQPNSLGIELRSGGEVAVAVGMCEDKVRATLRECLSQESHVAACFGIRCMGDIDAALISLREL